MSVLILNLLSNVNILQKKKPISRLLFKLFFAPDRLYSKDKVDNVAHPHHRKDNAGHQDALPCHHEKSKAHKQCDSYDYAEVQLILPFSTL